MNQEIVSSIHEPFLHAEVVANMAKMQEKGLALDERDRRILYYVSPLKPEAGGALKVGMAW